MANYLRKSKWAMPGRYDVKEVKYDELSQAGQRVYLN